MRCLMRLPYTPLANLVRFRIKFYKGLIEGGDKMLVGFGRELVCALLVFYRYLPFRGCVKFVHHFSGNKTVSGVFSSLAIMLCVRASGT